VTAALAAAELAALLGAATPRSPLPEVRGATHHSGRVRPGDAFFAVAGADHHGIEHADQALAAGASLVVSDRPHPAGILVSDPGSALLRLGAWARGRMRAPVIGVTGSAGKTTARALLAASLDAQASEGNLNTPHALAGRLMRAWSDDPTRPLVLELGIDHEGEMERLVRLVRPDVGMVTRIAAAHLGGLSDEATVLREKAKLLHAAPRGLVADAAWRLLPDDLAVSVLRYGLEGDASWRGRVGGEPLAPTLELEAPVQIELSLPGLGTGLAESAVGALAAAAMLNVSLDVAAERLRHAQLEPGRLTPRRGNGFTVLDDSYNANPASLRQALELLRSAPGPRTAVLGEMLELGPDAAAHHRALGEASRGLDRVLFVGRYGEAVLTGNPAAEIVPDADAERAVSDLPRTGTILVKASRGLRFERLVRALLGGDA